VFENALPRPLLKDSYFTVRTFRTWISSGGARSAGGGGLRHHLAGKDPQSPTDILHLFL